MNPIYIEFEKNAESVAKSLAKILGGTSRFVAKHPLGTLAGIGSVGVLGALLDAANKLRGTHQIVNEAGKRQVMNYQTEILKEIAQNVRRQEAQKPQKQQTLIIPPLR